jgi:hypothetical protein
VRCNARFLRHLIRPRMFLAHAAIAAAALQLSAQQQPAPAPLPTLARPIATVAVDGVGLNGVLSVANGRATVANNGEIIASNKTAEIDLVRGGTLELCQSTILHISKDASAQTAAKPDDAGLMFSLERGAFQTDYTPGAYSDVILTPDLRLLISGPGHADLRLRVNAQGDTCVDNPGVNAPYVVASSLIDGGAYRVRPGQRVLFVHGSLNSVVDNEREPCGCPPAAPPPSTTANGKAPHTDNSFPLAESEGLQPPPALPGTPVVPAGEAHAQVTATLSSDAPPGTPPTTPPETATDTAAGAQTTAAAAPARPPAHKRGFFHSIGHFFARVFGAD